MSDITINNDKNQDHNQKTTPVTESFPVLHGHSIALPGLISQIWLAVKDLILNPQNYVGIVKEFNTELAKTILDKNIRTKLVDKPIF